MAETEKKEVTRVAKSKPGYGYKYTELAQINELLEQRGESYYQYTDTFNDKDYIMTVKIAKDGTQSAPLRGAPIVTGDIVSKANMAQQLGAAITYARRYSLLMAYGLATEDDDAESLTRKPQQGKASTKPVPPNKVQQDEVKATPEQVNQIYAIVNKFPESKLMEQIRKNYHVDNVYDLSKVMAAKCITQLAAFEESHKGE